MSKSRKGVYAAAITPLDANGYPDGAKLATYCRHLIDEGLDGVAPLGTTGEGNSMPMRFRLDVPGIFAQAGFASDQVLFGTGASALGDAIALTKASLDAGFPSVLVLPPFYYKNPSDEGLYAYYSGLIEGVGDDRLRVYLYHFPQMSMTPISIGLIQRLKAKFGLQIAGLKDSSGDFAGSLAYVDAIEDFEVFPSNEGVLLEAMAKGCGGVISATTNVAPALVRKALSASSSKAVELQAQLVAIRQAVSKHSLMAAIKQIEAWRSGDDSWLRLAPPLTQLSTDQIAILKTDLGKIGLGPAAWN